MFGSKKVSANERNRVFDYLIFKIKHGGNIVNALHSYMDGNKSKQSRPIQEMLDRMANNGDAFVDVALEYGLIDRRGYLILNSSVEPAKALPVIRQDAEYASSGVSQIIGLDVAKKLGTAFLFAAALASESTRKPMVEVFNKMNMAAKAASATQTEIPAYLANQWLVMYWVLGFAAAIGAIFGLCMWANKHRTDLLYKYLPFRFYEDWVGLLDLYLAFRASGQSDYKAALSLAASQPEGSFNAVLFTTIAESMRKSGRSFYDALAEYEGSIPSEVMSFFLDASKTGRVDAYMGQAKTYCAQRLSALTKAASVWVPALTGVLMLMSFGLMVADLFVSITMASMKPITG